MVARNALFADVVVEHEITGSLAVDHQRNREDLDVDQLAVLASAPRDHVDEALLVGLTLQRRALLEEGGGREQQVVERTAHGLSR
jgi:hypothetical protein